MSNEYSALIVLVILLVLIIVRECSAQKRCSHVDGRCYNVYTNGAQNILGTLNQRALGFLRFLRARLNNNEYSADQQIWVRNLLYRYNPDNIRENWSTSTSDTSFVKSKGEDIAFCLTDPLNDNKIHSLETIWFVKLHEMSHLADTDTSSEHKKEFWRIFKFILEQAQKAGLYNPQDYSQSPISYCGISVNYNPYYDQVL